MTNWVGQWLFSGYLQRSPLHSPALSLTLRALFAEVTFLCVLSFLKRCCILLEDGCKFQGVERGRQGTFCPPKTQKELCSSWVNY